jgi:hypothetical protein
VALPQAGMMVPLWGVAGERKGMGGMGRRRRMGDLSSKCEVLGERCGAEPAFVLTFDLLRLRFDPGIPDIAMSA